MSIMKRRLKFTKLLCGVLLLMSWMNCQTILAQQLNVTGKVTSIQTNEPLAGVTVLEKGTTNGTLTDIGGNYSLTVTNSNAILTLSFIGYETQEIRVGTQRVINITLSETVTQLDEIVVTGYQTQRKIDLTGSVSVVKMDEITDNPGGSPIRSIQGRIPGVYITSDGSPSGGIRGINIRGLNTLGNTNPLYVIDGIPTTSSTILQSMDPNSIASIQVLKDASAASIYGSRASNGVIVIATKEGKDRKSISFSTGYTFQKYVRRVDMCNTEELGRLVWQASINDQVKIGGVINPNGPIYTYDWHYDANGVEVLDAVHPVEFIAGDPDLPGADTDWQKEVFRTGIISSNSLTINSGSETSNLMVNLSYYGNKGLVINNDYKRVSGRVNSSVSFFQGKFKIGENIQISSSSEIPVPNDLGGNSVLQLATVIQPILPVFRADGVTYSGPQGSGFSDRNNPLHISSINLDDRDNSLRMFGNLFAEVSPIKNLLFRSSFGLDLSTGNSKNIERAFSTGFLSRSVNSLSISMNSGYTWTWANTLNYQLKVNRHSATFLVGMEAIKSQSKNLSGRRETFAIEDVEYYVLNAGTGTATNGGGEGGSTLLSYFGKVNYSFNDRYLASVTVREDGSSAFGLNNRFGLFPSASVGWILSKEEFISGSLPFISFLKLRASVGRVGNQSIGADARFGLYSPNYASTSYDLSGVGTGNLPSGFVMSQRANNDLKWETTDEINAGIDLGFLSQKITASFDYFSRKTKDILITPSIPSVTAEGARTSVNGASVSNKGWELELGYNGSVGDFDFNVTGTASHFYDKVTYLPPSVVTSYGGNTEKNILGRSRTSVFGYITDGLFQTQEEVDAHATQAGKGIGRIRYKDLNEDGKIDALDQDWLGTTIPDVEYGVNVSVSYKGLNLSMFMRGVQGITINDGTKGFTDFMGTVLGVNKGTALLNAWTPQDPTATIPRISLTNSNSETRSSTYFLVNGSYFKLASMQLSYSLPKKILQFVKLSDTRIYALGENLLLIKDKKGVNAFTGPDPETPGTVYPQPVKLTIGLDVRF
jgi:TonB-linked SusC/RagA family outer membrane protein